MNRTIVATIASLALLAGSIGCGGALAPGGKDGGDDLGRPVLSLLWKFALANRARDPKPQEFASAVAAIGVTPDEDRLYLGSHEGDFYSISGHAGTVRWRTKLGSVSSRPALFGKWLYIGTDDGNLVCLSAVDGKEAWRYRTRGPVLEPPVIVDDLVIFSNENDYIYALDRQTGKFRWQYKAEPPEFTVRGHAGVVVDGDLVYGGFANGTMVALRAATGTVAWLASLKSEDDRYVDIDTTPVVAGETLYAASSSGGLYALDKGVGRVKWRAAIDGVGALAADETRLYAVAAGQGAYALDHAGHVIWRQGTRGGGEPADLVVTGDYVIYSLSDAGMYVADKWSGKVLQYFDPGYGVSSTPTLAREKLYVLSNSAIFYAFSLRRF